MAHIPTCFLVMLSCELEMHLAVMFVHAVNQCYHFAMAHIITDILNNSCQDLQAPYKLQIVHFFSFNMTLPIPCSSINGFVVMCCYHILKCHITLHVIFFSKYNTSYSVKIIIFTSSVCLMFSFFAYLMSMFATKSVKHWSSNVFGLLEYLSMLLDNLTSSEFGCNCCSVSVFSAMTTH